VKQIKNFPNLVL